MIPLVFCLLLPNVYSDLSTVDDYFSLNPMYRGSMDYVLENDTFVAGGRMDIPFTVSNLESFPVANAFLVIEVVSGKEERIYPTQFAENDSLFFFVADAAWLKRSIVENRPPHKVTNLR